ncbi:MORN repeat-containing protein 3-like isoform X2 [Dendropsophus ebraccatus]|uniref:MORN repeat-containing protein 3-like isoform X2 n=1 Tax=Dendropsophus ebraccatus TaxID=150705 RepID=UPI003831DA19
MLLLKTTKSIEPQWKDWDRKAQKSGLRNTVYSINGDEYTGEWINNLMHGKGKYVYKKANAIYQGDWICGRRSGYGTFAVKDASTGEYIRVYAGNWINDKKHGAGTYYYSDDEYYEGSWESSKRSGWGKMFYANGDIYEGEWRSDKHCGLGKLYLANKNCYEGSWRNGLKHGPGKYYFFDTGRIYDGFWVKDIPKCGTLKAAGYSKALSTKRRLIPEGITNNTNSPSPCLSSWADITMDWPLSQ